MADDNKDASWLSKEEQIRNPYFGEVMHKCGSVKEVIEISISKYIKVN